MMASGDLANLQRLFSNHPLTCDSPAKAWARFAWWQLRSRCQDEIIFQWIGEQQLAVRRGMVGVTGNIYVGLLEFADMMMVLHFLREGDLFLDIGANAGAYTVLASGISRARTWAFEPDPLSVDRLKRNITINGLDALVRVCEFALGAERGEVAFTFGRDAGNRIAAANEKSSRMARLEQLDAVVEDYEPIMIKMDIEGGEEGALQGAKALLAKSSLRVIEIETITSTSARILSENQFEQAYYDPFRRSLHRKPIDLKASNYLFVREWPFVCERLAMAKEVEILSRMI